MANQWFETVAIAQQRAKKRLPASSYARSSQAPRPASMRDNTSAFDELGFRPVTAGQPAERQMDTTIMGQPSSMPVMISPTVPRPSIPTARSAWRAAANRGIPMGLSSFAPMPIETPSRSTAGPSSRSIGPATRTRWSLKGGRRPPRRRHDPHPRRVVQPRPRLGAPQIPQSFTIKELLPQSRR